MTYKKQPAPFEAILIDSRNQTIKKIMLANSDQLRSTVGGYIEAVPVNELEGGDMLYVDEEGLLKPQTAFFEWRTYPQPLAGNGVIVGEEILDQEGELVGHEAVSISIEQVRELVTFRDRAYVESWGKGNASEPASSISFVQGDKVKTEVISNYGQVIADIPKVVSWCGEVIADNSGNWTRNAQRFATKEEAQSAVDDLFVRWTAVRERRVVETSDPVNYRWDVSTNKAVGL